ncbi:MAG: hypothetical protein N4A76_10390 [Firmicutes bacterium]|jgi:hypothetical protein|nr:hypothetical protein [Bacillota bacterium]
MNRRFRSINKRNNGGFLKNEQVRVNKLRRSTDYRMKKEKEDKLKINTDEFFIL